MNYLSSELSTSERHVADFLSFYFTENLVLAFSISSFDLFQGLFPLLADTHLSGLLSKVVHSAGPSRMCGKKNRLTLIF